MRRLAGRLLPPGHLVTVTHTEHEGKLVARHIEVTTYALTQKQGVMNGPLTTDNPKRRTPSSPLTVVGFRFVGTFTVAEF